MTTAGLPPEPTYEQVMELLNTLSKGIRWRAGEEEPFPEPLPSQVVSNLEEAVLLLSQQQTTNPKELGRYLKGPRYHLYRLLQAASAACLGANSLNEDGLTLAFVTELNRLAAKAKEAQTNYTLEVRQHPVMLHRLPALQESHVGADVALMLAGEELLGHKGAKVFWLQAKRPTSQPFTLRISQENAECKFRQASTLLSMNSLEHGSHALYLMHGHQQSPKGATALWTAEAQLAILRNAPGTERLHERCSREKRTSSQTPSVCSAHQLSAEPIPTHIDFTAAVCRIQEHITGLLVHSPDSMFLNITTFRRFLGSKLNVPLPRTIFGVAAQGDTSAARLLEQMGTTIATALYKQKVAASKGQSRSLSRRPRRD